MKKHFGQCGSNLETLLVHLNHPISLSLSVKKMTFLAKPKKMSNSAIPSVVCVKSRCRFVSKKGIRDLDSSVATTAQDSGGESSGRPTCVTYLRDQPRHDLLDQALWFWGDSMFSTNA